MANKFKTLMDFEGYDDPMDFLEYECMGSGLRVGVPSICMTEGCDYTTDMEPDQDRGWCEECQSNTVKSALVLYGII